MKLPFLSMIFLAIAGILCVLQEPNPTDEEIIKLVKAINDNPDPLHSDHTPAVHALIKRGLSSVPHVLKLMTVESSDTRMRSQRVLEGVTMAQYGFVSGKGWTKSGGEQQWMEFWTKLGNLCWTESLEKRTKSIVLWEKWIAEKKK